MRKIDLEPYRDIVMRVLLGVVFLYFGIHKFADPRYWFMWLPSILSQFVPSGPYGIVYAIGAFEFTIGSLLVLGLFVRYVAALGSGFLLLILLTLGVNSVTARDIGLLGAALYLALTRERATTLNFGLKTTHRIVLLAFLVVIIAGAFFALPGGQAVVQPAVVENSQSDSKTLLFLSPGEGAALTSGNVKVKLRILADLKKLGISHLHLKLDGRVVDAIYLTAGTQEVTATLPGVSPGRHVLSAYLAYIDHIEIQGYATSVTFTSTTQ